MGYRYNRQIVGYSMPDKVEQWKSDLRKMTRIYKSIPAATEEKQLEYYMEARRLFVTFRDNFETWVYSELLPSRQPEKQSWQERQVAKAAWNAAIAINTGQLFPESWNYTKELHEPAPYQIAQKIDTNITRYQRAFNVAFKEIETLLKDRESQGAPGGAPALELLHVGPVQVVVHNTGRASRDPSVTDSLDDELRSIGDAIRQIQRAGFPEAIRGLSLHVTFESERLIAGHYNSETDEIWLRPLGMGREDHETLIHECGHRFYYRSLPANAREHWSEIINGRALTINEKDVDYFIDTYVKPKFDQRGLTPERHEIFEAIKQRNEPPEVEAKMRDLADSIPIRDDRGIEGIREFVKENKKGQRVDLEKITDYGATNEKEAFAEAFMLYVVKGPRAVGPWTRNFFETISRAGGAKLARVLIRAALKRSPLV